MDVDLQACLRGDKRAWDAFVARWSPLIASTVRRTIDRSTRPGLDVDDPVQEVFVRLVRNDFRLLGTYDPARASLSTWLSIVARSVAIDHVRRKLPPGGASLDDHDPPAPDPPRPATTPVVPLHVLTARQRLVLRMLFDEDLSVGEAANLIGVDEQTVRSTKHKALTRLREHLGVGREADSEHPG